jgi:hypothetical protein
VSFRDAISLKTTLDKGNSKESLNFKLISDCLVEDGTLRHPITLTPEDLYNLSNGNTVPSRQHKTGIFGFQSVEVQNLYNFRSLKTEKL